MYPFLNFELAFALFPSCDFHTFQSALQQYLYSKLRLSYSMLLASSTLEKVSACSTILSMIDSLRWF